VPDTVDIELMSSERLRNALSAQDRIAIDTEFVRERTFFSQLCLVQIASGEDIYCVDPLADTASDARAEFWELMMRSPWVLHSGRQDIEVIYQSAGAMPESVFDTQVAAALLGYAPQMGYAGMVAELFDVQLAKTHTRADWSKRPLTDALLEYAAEDVIYLLPARDLLCERLQQLGRLAWAEQDSADLLRPQLYDIDPDLAVARLKGARNLKGVMRSASVRLAAWREREAVRSNRPRQWIMKDKMLLDIAAGQPATREELAALPGMSPRTADRASQDILAAVEAAKSDETDYKPPARPDAEQKALLKILQERVADLAGELGIANEIVAPRKELAAAVDGDRSGRVFSGWRAEIIGNELLELLES
jgi:ribonuclease D